ncbi:potassium transporter TrkH, partial [Escherichia coli]|nr:potassium transporter TrkH [Escherichia coli]
DVALSVLLFVCLYLITIIVGFIALMCTGLDLVSSFTGAIGALSNIGLGLGDKIGPAGNYATLSNTELWIFSIIMIAGR